MSRFPRLPSVFVRLTGRSGVVREYRALVSPTAEYSLLPKVDAFRLVYPEAAAADNRVPSPSVVSFASYMGWGRGTSIKMAKVELGRMTFRDVDFMAFDPLQALGYDVVLGLTMLQHLHLDLDLQSHIMKLRMAGDST